MSVIADLDLLTDVLKVRQVVLGLGVDEESLPALMWDIAAVAEELRAMPPTIKQEDMREQLRILAEEAYDWVEGHDASLRAKLSELRNALDGMRRLKFGGVSALPDELGSRVQLILTRLESIGLFLVPVGELEGWLSNAEIKAPKSKKWAWANEAALYLRNTEAREGDIWEFTRRISDYLSK